MSRGSQEQRDAPQIGKRAARRNQVPAERKPTPEVTGIAHDIKKALRSDSWDAFNALNQEFGDLLYDAKDKTCRAAFSALKVAIGRDDKLHVLGEHLIRWVDEIVYAIRTYLPYYASLADTGRVPRHKKWHWVEDAIREKLRSCCVELGAPAFWGFLWNVGPIETWTPLEWWLFNACSTANTFLLLRRESASIPEWLRPTTNPSSDPAGYYDMKLKTRLATALRKALNLAKIEAATGRQLPSQAIPVQDVLTTAIAPAGQANPINPSEPLKERRKLSKFDELAGRLMFEARPLRGDNGRLPSTEYNKIVTALDSEGLRPLNHLERRDRDRLASWNSRVSRSGIPIKSFAAAFKSPGFSRAVRRRLSRALGNWSKAHPELSA